MDVHGSVSALLDDGTGTDGTAAAAVKAVYGYKAYGGEDSKTSKGDTKPLEPTNGGLRGSTHHLVARCSTRAARRF